MSRKKPHIPVVSMDRLTRCMNRSGRRVRRNATGWGVYNSGDRRCRPLLRLSEAQTAELIAAGQLIGDEARGYTIADAPSQTETRTRLVTPQCESRARFRGKRSGFARLVGQALDGEGALSLGQARAGLRLSADIELACAGPLASQNWALDTRLSGGRRQSSGGLPPKGQAALMRLQRLRKHVPAADLELASAACGKALNLRTLEQMFDLPRHRAAKTLSQALERIRLAYDKKIPYSETGNIRI